MASQITSLTSVNSNFYSGRSKKTSKLHITGLCAGNSPVTCEVPAQRPETWSFDVFFDPVTGEFPAQMASNVENVSIWWCHRDSCHWLQWKFSFMKAKTWSEDKKWVPCICNDTYHIQFSFFLVSFTDVLINGKNNTGPVICYPSRLHKKLV